MNELPKRKSTRWKLFDYSNPGLYFLTICTKDRRNLLSHITVGDDASASREDNILRAPKVELTEIGKIVEKYIHSTEKIENVFVDKYVIMPNHIHLIIYIKDQRCNNKTDGQIGTPRASSPTNKTLPKIVSALKRLCNKEIGENIFQRSYYDHIIRDEKDYETRVNYIYENPTRWFFDELYNE